MAFSSNVLGLLFVFAAATPAWAGMPSTPENDPNFLLLPTGQDLRKVKVSGAPLGLVKGTGVPFADWLQTAYLELKRATQAEPRHPVQWVLMDLDSHQTIASSASPRMKQFGASVSKVFVAATLMDRQNGAFRNASQLQHLANMIVVSSNTSWTELQRQIGDGDSDRGRATIHAFTQRMGYLDTRGFQGNWGSVHGNELTAHDLAEFLHDTYQNRYPGAETVWKVMHTSRTGVSRAKKYLPLSLYVGGKTGTYDGPTIDPETGLPTGPDGKPFRVQVRHQVIVFRAGGRQLGLAILANTGSDESAALLAGGLYREMSGRLPEE